MSGLAGLVGQRIYPQAEDDDIIELSLSARFHLSCENRLDSEETLIDVVHLFSHLSNLRVNMLTLDGDPPASGLNPLIVDAVTAFTGEALLLNTKYFELSTDTLSAGFWSSLLPTVRADCVRLAPRGADHMEGVLEAISNGRAMTKIFHCGVLLVETSVFVDRLIKVGDGDGVYLWHSSWEQSIIEFQHFTETVPTLADAVQATIFQMCGVAVVDEQYIKDDVWPSACPKEDGTLGSLGDKRAYEYKFNHSKETNTSVGLVLVEGEAEPNRNGRAGRGGGLMRDHDEKGVVETIILCIYR